MSKPLGTLSGRDYDILAAVAVSVGQDVWNPEGGLNTTASDEVILETVCDIAQGTPYSLAITLDDLSGAAKHHILNYYWKGVGDGAVR